MLWKNKNAFEFEGKEYAVEATVEKIKDDARQWFEVHLPTVNNEETCRRRNSKVQWKAPSAASNSAPEPEVDPTPYSTSQGANQDIRALKMSYLTNQEGLNHETNFDGFYTQEGVQANWNWANIFPEQEVMNFTIQRFLNPSICEYPTLEKDLSSIKERPEAKPIIGVKRSLSDFQKA
ncbi:hypothetical protein DY000_02046887 [Brassica cretica]|uniref:Uncharacterized protein n=1 Tax=Brassica cretica TaxID=69181 RepID=A0ABQ7EXL7_BRACR|nr:hypothetical protein DY000_02046887 [Brassica cretica]